MPWEGLVDTADDLQGQNVKRATIKWRLQGTNLIEKNTQRPHVTLEVVRGVLYDLRREVVRCSDNCLCYLGGRLQDFGDTKVTKLDYPLLCQEYILTLQIAMQYLPVMDVLNGKAYLSEPAKYHILREVASLIFLLLDHV